MSMPNRKRREELRKNCDVRIREGFDRNPGNPNELRALLDALDRRTAWMEEARPYLKRHGWCLHHKADRGEDKRGHADGDNCWRLVSELDAELEQDND